MKIEESGLMQVWIHRWWPKRKFCAGSFQTEAHKLNFLDLQSVFYVGGIGLTVSVLVIAVELSVGALFPTLRLSRRPQKSPSLQPDDEGYSVN